MILIRPEIPTDLEAIRALLVAAFSSVAENRLVEALRTSGRLILSLVAEVQGEIVGHVAFSPVTVGDAIGAGLAPLAVRESHRGRGIATHLVREGLAGCERVGYGFAVVLGAPGYYGRFGFRPSAAWGLTGEHGGGDSFQAIELKPASIPRGSGVVSYAPEFSNLAFKP